MTTYSIYRITNLCNNKVYIGWTSRTPSHRFGQHKSNKSSSIGLAIKKYGKENFLFDVIYQSQDIEHSKKMECYFILEYNSLVGHGGYNIESGGDGKQTSELTKKKLSEAHLGKKLSDEHKKKISESAKKRKQSEESKRKLSETRKKLISDGDLTVSAWNKGKVLSDEHKLSLKLAWERRKLKQLQH